MSATESASESTSHGLHRASSSRQATPGEVTHQSREHRAADVWLFGSNQHQQLGIPIDNNKDGNTNANETRAVVVQREPAKAMLYGETEFDDVIDLALGPFHTLGLGANGRVYTAGTGAVRLGCGGATEVIPLFKMIGSPLLEHTVLDVACGFDHSIAVTVRGQVYVWGDNSHGQLGMPRDRLRSTAIPTLNRALTALGHAAGGISQVSCGNYHTLALTRDSGQVFAFGKALSHQLGTGTDTERDSPTLVEALNGLHVVEIACGSYHSLALTRDGQVFAWGSNVHGQLGIGEHSDHESLPALLTRLPRGIVSIACGAYHSAAIPKTRKRLYVWGHGLYGRLGTGDEDDAVVPKEVQVMDSEDGKALKIYEVALGGSHTLVRAGSSDDDCRLYACGDGKECKLGFGANDTRDRVTLSLVSDGEKQRISAVYAGEFCSGYSLLSSTIT